MGIADAISRGKTSYLGQDIEVSPGGEKVIYFDFELGDKGFQK